MKEGITMQFANWERKHRDRKGQCFKRYLGKEVSNRNCKCIWAAEASKHPICIIRHLCTISLRSHRKSMADQGFELRPSNSQVVSQTILFTHISQVLLYICTSKNFLSEIWTHVNPSSPICWMYNEVWTAHVPLLSLTHIHTPTPTFTCTQSSHVNSCHQSQMNQHFQASIILFFLCNSFSVRAFSGLPSMPGNFEGV